jgi:hypothetical protein
MCNIPDAKACATCNSVWYCSEKCQTKDSHLHNFLCKDFIEFKAGRPDAHHKLAFFFSTDPQPPKLIWVRCNCTGGCTLCQFCGECCNSAFSADLVQYLSLIPPSGTDTIRDGSNNEKGGLVEHHHTGLDFYDGPGKTNEGIFRATKGEAGMDRWMGPVVVLADTMRSCCGKRYQDITLADFREAINYFIYRFKHDR